MPRRFHIVATGTYRPGDPPDLASFVPPFRPALSDATTPKQTGSNGVGRAILDLLVSDPVCEDIVIYFNAHPRAVDTPRGIAEWWIHRDPRGTEDALMRLLGLGVVQAHVHGPTRIFGYTKGRTIRRAIAAYVKSLNRQLEPRGGG
jgi:hypothetical protein